MNRTTRALVLGLTFGIVGAHAKAAWAAPESDLISDQVGATAGEFRVDESGAATYSIPIYTVPGTAGVTPKLALSYSSQGGIGPLGKGWSISGLSSIGRCRATREAGDFIVSGEPTDGNPTPVNFSGSDKLCLDGQRLLQVTNTDACAAVPNMSRQQLRTELESFQRVCAYTPSGSANGPAFFTVERKDGSLSWYGDRNNYGGANRPDGYVETNAAGHTAKALLWAQTRFQDSTGNYIEFIYAEDPGGEQGALGEHLIKEVRYTGKVKLPGQDGNFFPPYAKIVFNYVPLPRGQWAKRYQSGATFSDSRQMISIESWVDHDYDENYTQVRHYALDYDASPSPSNAGVNTLDSVRECRDGSLTVCLEATVFFWSQASNQFVQPQAWAANWFGSAEKFEGFKLGDLNGDGRQDVVWLIDGSDGDSCPTEHLMIALAEIDGEGRPTFVPKTSQPTCTPTELMTGLGEDSWQLFDYDGDGKDDLFVFNYSGWAIYPAVDDPSRGMIFDTGNNLIAGLSPAIPGTAGEEGYPQLADVNGDGLPDVVYPRNQLYYVRIMERIDGVYAWGAERQINFQGAAVTGLFRGNGNFQLHDFNGDGASDLLVNADQVLHAMRFESITPTTVGLRS